LTELKIDGLVTQLERALQLQNDAVSIESTDERDVWQAALDGRTLTFGVRSSLRGDRAAESSTLDRDYSDHELTVQLPEVAYEVLDTLE
jgi:hypothetical protein